MRATTDTIAAIATPAGRGGVGIVRAAGADVETLIAGIVGAALTPRHATLANFRDAHGAILDQGIAIHFPAPHSYTGDDVLELHGHGGRAVLAALLARCVELGARLAQPGEFTQRAFLNDKIDLAQAEGVADLIDAATATAARAATRSLTGEFSREVGALAEQLIDLRTLVEATLDFPEEDIDFLRAHDAKAHLDAVRHRLESILSRAHAGTLLRNGLTVVLIGCPNVGKSSLLNRLVREDAAIVTPFAGTTRDTIERQVEIAGIPISVVDTAGLRESDDAIEQLGIARSWGAVARADLAIVLMDAREPAESPADAAIIGRLDPALPRLHVHNKADLAGINAVVEMREGERHLWLSALTGDGVALLEREVLTIAGASRETDDTFLARERHVVALREASSHIAAADRQIVASSPALELLAEELRAAHGALSSITGAYTSDDLLGAIFGRFCIGK